ncbi:MAG: response regulator [Methanobacterium sp.]|nr:response regulator [Methanobacterium sp.]
MGNPTRILIIEDNIRDVRLIQEMLKEVRHFNFEFTHVERLDKGLKCIENDGFDVLLLDLNLPDNTGLDTFIKARNGKSNLPIVILSGESDEETAIEAVHQGAQDYLMKGEVDGKLLARSIFYAIERKATEEELIKHRDHLEELVEKRTLGLKEANKKLRREINERKLAEEEIRASLEEKKILLDEIQERIQNSLQTIISIIDAEYFQNGQKKPKDFNQEIQNRAKAVELINEKLYQSEDFAMIDFACYIRELTDYLFDFYGVDSNLISFKMDVEGIPLDIDVAIPCGLIINEIVTNSLKHAFPDERKGQICIKFHSDNNNTVLTVWDDGIGFKEEINIEKADTSGLRLVNKLVKQLDGKIEVNTSKGTEFKIIF